VTEVFVKQSKPVTIDIPGYSGVAGWQDPVLSYFSKERPVVTVGQQIDLHGKPYIVMEVTKSTFVKGVVSLKLEAAA
jgi:hypothetical protein